MGLKFSGADNLKLNGTSLNGITLMPPTPTPPPNPVEGAVWIDTSADALAGGQQMRVMIGGKWCVITNQDQPWVPEAATEEEIAEAIASIEKDAP